MAGTGVTLSERFKGLNPWKLSSLEEEFEQRSTSGLSLSNILKLSSLAVTVDGKSKSKRLKVPSSRKYATTSLHKLFSQKSTGKEAKTEKLNSGNGDTTVDQKKRIDPSNVEKSKCEKSGEVPLQGAKQVKPSNSEALIEGSKQTNIDPAKGSVNLPQNGVTPSTERPRDPRLLYGKGSYSILAKTPGAVPQSGKPAVPEKSENQDTSEKSSKSENPDKSKNPVKKKRSFGESLCSDSGAGLEAVGKKLDGGKTIQVVKRNAVTKKITGVVQMNMKRKPLQNTDPNKPPVKTYSSSHNALQRIAEAKKVEDITSAAVSDAEVATLKALKGILQKDNLSVDSAETSEKGLESAVTSVTKVSIRTGNALKEDKSEQSVVKQSTNTKKPVKGKVKGSTKVAKPKQDVKNKTVSMTPNTPNIVLKFSITPSMDNGKFNLTVVSSSEDDQEKSDSKEQNVQMGIPLSIKHNPKGTESAVPEVTEVSVRTGNALMGIPLSIEHNPKAAALSADDRKELDKPKQVPVTDEELKKGSPIQVHISNGANGYKTTSSASMSTINDVSTSLAEGAHISVGLNETKSDQGSMVPSGCIYTTARKMAQVSTHQSVVQINNSPPVPISYVYGSVASSSKAKPDIAQPVQTPYKSGYGIDGTQIQQHIPRSNQYEMPPNDHQGNEIWPHHQPSVVTQPSIVSAASSNSLITKGNVGMTESFPVEVHEDSLILGHSEQKEAPSNHPISENMPITVRIQQTAQNANKAIQNKEGPCKPVHRTLTAIASASEKEMATCSGADNFDLVDMEISTPVRHVPNSIETISNEADVVPANRVGNSSVVTTLKPDEIKNAKSDAEETKTAGRKDSEVISPSEWTDGEVKSRVDGQQAQVASWTTYLHEDTNSPMRSAFGSKQSFKEALSSLQSTLQTVSHSGDAEISKDEATAQHQVIEIPNDPSLSTDVQHTPHIDVTSNKSQLVCVPKKTLLSPSASPVSQNISEVSGNAFQPDRTVPLPCLDVPTDILRTNHTSENASAQNTLRIELPNPPKVDGGTGNSMCNGTSQFQVETVTDGRNGVSVPTVIKSADSGNDDSLESQQKMGVVSKDNSVVDTCVTSSVILEDRGIFEDTLKRSKSPGTPVEDEFSNQDPFGPKERMNYETQSRTDHFALSDIGGPSSMKYEEENNNACHEKENEPHYHVKDETHRHQLDFNRGGNRYPDSPRNRQRPVYMRELSNVSDISIENDEFGTFEDGYSQEALEPLLVRGRDTRMDPIEYSKDDPRISRREMYEDDQDYSDRTMSSHPCKEPHSRYTHPPSPRMERLDNEESVYPYSQPVERVHRYEAPDRPIQRYREEQSPDSRIYAKSDVVLSRRDSGGQFQETPVDPMIREQMTAVQALQIQINAAVNPAHRAALVMALQALTGGPVQSSTGEVRPEVEASTVPDRLIEYRDVSDDVSAKHFRDDSVHEDPGNRKVEFTVVLRDDDEQFLRKDSANKSRTGDHSKVQRHPYDAQERYPDSSAQHEHGSQYYRIVELNDDPHSDYPRQDGIRKERIVSREIPRTVGHQRGTSLENSADSDGERRSSSRSRHGQSLSPEKRDKKQKKSISKKSKKKAKEFHGRPLIKDKTNKTDPYFIPLEDKDIVHRRIDPRRSLTPDPAGGPKELRPLTWPHAQGEESKKISRSKGRKNMQKDKMPHPKQSDILPCSKNLNCKHEESVRGILNNTSCAEALAKENSNECLVKRVVHPEVVGNKEGKASSDGKEKGQIKEALGEITDKPDHVIEQTITEFVSEARVASSQVNSGSKEQHDDIAREEHASCATHNDQIEGTNCDSVENASLDHIRNGKGSEDERRLDTSNESTTPTSSQSGGKKKRKSPESKKYDYGDDEVGESDYKRTPQKRKLSERSPERRRKYKHTGNDGEKTRHKRKYVSGSESDIDSDRGEHVREPGSKFKHNGHFSRFNKGYDWRSAKSGPFRPGSRMRSRTPSQRFDYRKYIYPGNLGKPYGNQKTVSSGRGRGKGFSRGGRAHLPGLWREKETYCIDFTKEFKNSPSKSMASLGYTSIVSWEDIHVALSEIKAKMHAVENSSREVRKASSQLQVAPLLKVHKSALTALQCIMSEVFGRISIDRREMYLHRRKYEILMADIRIHAEVLGKLIPPSQEEAMLSEFVPNTTGIPRVKPAIELKVMNWLSLMANSEMLLAVKEIIKKKRNNLEYRVDAMKALDKKQPRRVEDRVNRHFPRSRQWSGSDISPDTTRPECGNHRDAGQVKLEVSPEVRSCPEFCPSTPETPVEHTPRGFSEIRLPTHYRTGYREEHPEAGPSTDFKCPPEPVRKPISTSEENLVLMDICMPHDVDENVSFSLVDIPSPGDHRPAESDQCTDPVPSKDLTTEFSAADSSSNDVNDTNKAQEVSPECSVAPQMPYDYVAPSGFVNSFKPATPTRFHHSEPKFYISRVQRLASKTLMSPESGSDLQMLLKSDADRKLKRSKSQQSPSSSDEPASSQVDMSVGKSELKSPRYSKKRHFLAKFQSDSERPDDSPKVDSSMLCKSPEPVSTKIRGNNLNAMYNEYDESCLVDGKAKIVGCVPEPSPPAPTSNSKNVPSHVGPS